MRRRIVLRCAALLSVVVATTAAAAAAGAGDAGGFYKNKTVTIVTSTGPGGTYDLVARLLARVMPKYIPGVPTMVVENMPGAGNVLATNYMYNIAPKDGTMIATIHDAMPLYQALDGRGVRFDVKNFAWLGSTGPENEVVLVWHTADIKTFEDARKKTVIMGTTGAGSGISLIPSVMNHVLDTKFKLVIGYKSSEDINLAMVSGEVQARTFSMASIVAQHSDWIRDKKIVILAQAGETREKDLPDTPLLTELTDDPTKKEILRLVSSPSAFGHPFVAPPGVPADRVQVLHAAFDATLRDPDFKASLAKLQMTVDPTSGADLEKLAREVVDATPDIVAKTKIAVASLENKSTDAEK
jgi:tripartite-type tricarboxylate transporter receptor subunit TctC